MPGGNRLGTAVPCPVPPADAFPCRTVSVVTFFGSLAKDVGGGEMSGATACAERALAAAGEATGT